jgi:hypothetical protein
MTAETQSVKSQEKESVPATLAEDVTDDDKPAPVPPETTTADDDETILKPLNKHTP